MSLPLAWSIVFVLSVGLILLLRKISLRTGFLLDNPHNNNKAGIHTYPVPSVGGIAVVIAVMAGIWLRYGRFEAWNHIPFYLTVLILMAVGIIDDTFIVSHRVKLVTQAAIAILTIGSGIVIQGVKLGPLQIAVAHPFDYFFTIFYVMGMINAINMIDGLDGLAGGTGVIILTGVLIGSYLLQNTFPYMLAPFIIVALVAFLMFNFHPAKVFLGEVGSMFLGVTLAVLQIRGLTSGGYFYLGYAIIITAFPITDVLWSIIRRGKHYYKRDLDHLHHRLYFNVFNKSQPKTVLTLWGINLILLGIGVLTLLYYETLCIPILLTGIVGVAIMLHLLKRR